MPSNVPDVIPKNATYAKVAQRDGSVGMGTSKTSLATTRSNAAKPKGPRQPDRENSW
jgi:hypothetical protein